MLEGQRRFSSRPPHLYHVLEGKAGQLKILSTSDHISLEPYYLLINGLKKLHALSYFILVILLLKISLRVAATLCGTHGPADAVC